MGLTGFDTKSGVGQDMKGNLIHCLFTYIHTYTHTHIHTYIHTLVSILHQIIKRAGEGIAVTDGAGRSEKGACDLHRPIWIKENARKKSCQRLPNRRR